MVWLRASQQVRDWDSHCPCHFNWSLLFLFFFVTTPSRLTISCDFAHEVTISRIGIDYFTTCSVSLYISTCATTKRSKVLSPTHPTHTTYLYASRLQTNLLSSGAHLPALEQQNTSSRTLCPHHPPRSHHRRSPNIRLHQT